VKPFKEKFSKKFHKHKPAVTQLKQVFQANNPNEAVFVEIGSPSHKAQKSENVCRHCGRSFNLQSLLRHE
jgi:hypothetical protein